MRRRLIVMLAIAGLAVIAPVASACSVVIPGMGVEGISASITIHHHPHDPVPSISGEIQLHVVRAPQGGTITMYLQQWSTVSLSWVTLASDTVGNPWHNGQHKTLSTFHPCTRNSHVRLRLKSTWDGVNADGDPSHGTHFWPGRSGTRRDCRDT